MLPLLLRRNRFYLQNGSRVNASRFATKRRHPTGVSSYLLNGNHIHCQVPRCVLYCDQNSRYSSSRFFSVTRNTENASTTDLVSPDSPNFDLSLSSPDPKTDLDNVTDTNSEQSKEILRQLLIDKNENGPNRFASPASVLGEFISQRDNTSAGLKYVSDSKAAIEGQTVVHWHTASFVEPKTGEYFNAGTFGDFITKIKQNENFQAASFYSEETRVFDGRTYYRKIKLAKQAAAARAIDCLSSRAFLELMNDDDYNTEIEGKMPMRYCVEQPYLFPLFGDNIDFKIIQKHLHSPVDLWISLIQSRYGPIEVTFDISSLSVKAEPVDGDVSKEDIWFNAACVEPDTGEIFHSGVFNDYLLQQAGSVVLPTLKYFLPFEEFLAIGGKVYYKNEQTAKHAAAARALDCLSLRQCSEQLSGVSGCDDVMLFEVKETAGQHIKKKITKKRLSDSDFPYLSFAKSHSYLLHTPMSFLNLCLAKKYRHNELENVSSFESKSFGSDGQWHTATVTYPVTMEKFFSGTFAELNVDTKSNTSPSVPFHEAEHRISDGRVYYKNSQQALHAAAARAIDCMMFREEKSKLRSSIEVDKEARIQLCLEDPFEGANESDRQSIDTKSEDLDLENFRIAHSKNSELIRLCLEEPYFRCDETRQTIDYESLHDVVKKRRMGSEFSSLSLANSHPHEILNPKEFLNRCLAEKYHLSGVNRCYECESRSLGSERKWYTATFTDPATKETFFSGIFAKLDIDAESSNSSAPLHESEVRMFDGRIYHETRRGALHAAAARAVDCMMFREEKLGLGIPLDVDGKKAQRFQLCLEDPYESANDLDHQQIDYDALLAQNKIFLTERQVNESNLLDPSNTEIEYYDFRADTMEGAGENEEEYSIQFLSQPHVFNDSSGFRSQSALSTMGRIAEIWTDTRSHDSFIEESPKETLKSSGDPKYLESSTVPTPGKIDGILSWFKQVNSNPENTAQALAFSQLQKKILLALGNANNDSNEGAIVNSQSFQSDTVDVFPNIEEEAKRILDSILSLSSFSSHDSSCLDAEIFTSYIRCLNRFDPRSSARSAEKLLQGMVNNDDFGGITLPSPTVETYNAVMSLWSRVDGPDAQNGVNRIYATIEEALLSGVHCSTPKPNRETFKIVISSNSKIENHFSVNLANLWLERIKSAIEVLGDVSLLEDVGIYNAALEKSEMGSNFHPHSPLWLNYGQNYEDGFKSSNDDSQNEALEMEKWISGMDERGISPTIETYEHVIRAWVETGMLQGLVRAENWATRTVLSTFDGAQLGVIPRLETFHPIIAAWALCGDSRAPGRVKEWINQLIELSTSIPNLKPGLDIMTTQITAWRNFQATIAKNKDPGSIHQLIHQSRKIHNSASETQAHGAPSAENGLIDDVQNSFFAARNCKDCLEHILENSSDDDALSVWTHSPIFTQTIGAWGDASRLSSFLAPIHASSNPDHGLQEMFKVVDLLNGAMSMLREQPPVDVERNDSEIEEGDAFIGGQSPRNNADHLRVLECVGEAYAEAISHLHQVDASFANNSNEERSRFFFNEHISSVEQMLRAYEDISRKCYSNRNIPKSQTTCHRFYKEVLRGCMETGAPNDFGNVVRICSLILNNISWRNRNKLYSDVHSVEDMTDLYVDIATVIGKHVLNPHEKMMLLTMVYRNASKFFRQGQNTESKSGAKVSKANLIGAMRMALGESEMTEPFLNSFEVRKKRFKKRRSASRASRKYIKS